MVKFLAYFLPIAIVQIATVLPRRLIINPWDAIPVNSIATIYGIRSQGEIQIEPQGEILIGKCKLQKGSGQIKGINRRTPFNPAEVAAANYSAIQIKVENRITIQCDVRPFLECETVVVDQRIGFTWFSNDEILRNIQQAGKFDIFSDGLDLSASSGTMIYVSPYCPGQNFAYATFVGIRPDGLEEGFGMIEVVNDTGNLPFHIKQNATKYATIKISIIDTTADGNRKATCVLRIPPSSDDNNVWGNVNGVFFSREFPPNCKLVKTLSPVPKQGNGLWGYPGANFNLQDDGTYIIASYNQQYGWIQH